MYIPVTIGTGNVSAFVRMDYPGTFSAQCSFDFEGQAYAAGEEVEVEALDVVTLRAVVTGYQSIPVTLSGRTFYWAVNTPTVVTYANNLAYRAITGSNYGTLHRYPSGTVVPYVETDTFIEGQDAVASIDYLKGEVWIFNDLDQVRKLVVPGIVSAVFGPRWSGADSVLTQKYLVTRNSIRLLSDVFTEIQSWSVEDGVRMATGDVEGNIILMYPNKIVIWANGSVVRTITNGAMDDIRCILVSPENAIVFSTPQGIHRCLFNGTDWLTATILARAGNYISLDIAEDFLYATDAETNVLVSISNADLTSKILRLSHTPRDVTVTGEEAWISYFQSAKVDKYDLNLNFLETFEAIRSAGATYGTSYALTNLYTDAPNVLVTLNQETPELVRVIDIPLGAPFQYVWNVELDRPEYVVVNSNDVQVTVDAVPFTEGYIYNGSVVRMTVASNADYNHIRQVSFVGRVTTTFELRNLAKLFPDFEAIPTVDKAFPRSVNQHEYVLQGLTPGRTTYIYSVSPEILVSVNGSEFSNTATVENGDTLIVQVKPNTLFSQRTPHEIRVVSYEYPVTEWTVLPMVLDGVTLRPDSVEEKPKGVYLQRENTFLSQSGNLPEYLSVPVYSSDVQSAEALTTPMYTSDAPAPEFSTVSTFLSSEQGSLVASTTFTSMSTEGSGYKTSHTDIVQYPEFSFQNRGLYQPIQAAYDTIAYSVAAQVESSVYKFNTPRREEIEQVPYRYLTSPRIEQEPGVDRVDQGFRSLVTVDYGRNGQPFMSFVYAQYGRRLHPNHTYVYSEFDNRTRTHKEYVEQAFLRQIHADRKEWTIGDSIPVPYISTFRYWTQAIPERRTEIRPALNMDFDAVRLSHTEFGTNEPMPSRTRTVVVDIPTMDFVAHRHQNVELSELASGLGTEAQATAYAASINVLDPTLKTYVNKWIFLSDPTSTNPMCSITSVPSLLQRRFGYVSGG